MCRQILLCEDCQFYDKKNDLCTVDECPVVGGQSDKVL